MAQQLGGTVEGGHHREFGRADHRGDRRLRAVRRASGRRAARRPVWMSHGDRVTGCPPAFAAWRQPPDAPIAVIADETRKFYGMQFHPEVVHTPRRRQADRAISCARSPGCTGDWTMRAFRRTAIAKIRAQVGKGRVICGLSGGVDSAVAAVLIHEAIGDQLTCMFVDHGLLRLRRGRAAWSTCSATTTTSRWCTSTPAKHVPRRTRGRHRPRGQAQDHRPAVHRRVRGRGQEDRRRRFPGPGHALSRRDRERLLHRRAFGHHQVAPQCRRPARSA